MWSCRVIGNREFARTEGPLGVGTTSGIYFSPNSRPYNFHATTRNACPSLVTAHTYATLAFHWPQPTPTRCLHFAGTFYIHAMLASGIVFLILPTAGCLSTKSAGLIAGQGDILHSDKTRVLFFLVVGGFCLV